MSRADATAGHSDRADATGSCDAHQHQTAAAAAGSARPTKQQQNMNTQQIVAPPGKGDESEVVTKEEAHMAHWCSILILCRQLGKALVGLTSSVNSLLPVLPGNGGQ